MIIHSSNFVNFKRTKKILRWKSKNWWQTDKIRNIVWFGQSIQKKKLEEHDIKTKKTKSDRWAEVNRSGTGCMICRLFSVTIAKSFKLSNIVSKVWWSGNVLLRLVEFFLRILSLTLHIINTKFINSNNSLIDLFSE